MIGHNWLHCWIRKHDPVPKMSVANWKGFLLQPHMLPLSLFSRSRHSASKGLFDALKSFLINSASLLWPLGTADINRAFWSERSTFTFSRQHIFHMIVYQTLISPGFFRGSLLFYPSLSLLNLYTLLNAAHYAERPGLLQGWSCAVPAHGFA